MKESRDLLKLVLVLSTNPDTELSHLVPDFPGQLTDPELKKLLKKEKRARFALSHQRPIINDGRRRGLAGKN